MRATFRLWYRLDSPWHAPWIAVDMGYARLLDKCVTVWKVGQGLLAQNVYATLGGNGLALQARRHWCTQQSRNVRAQVIAIVLQAGVCAHLHLEEMLAILFRARRIVVAMVNATLFVKQESIPMASVRQRPYRMTFGMLTKFSVAFVILGGLGMTVDRGNVRTAMTH